MESGSTYVSDDLGEFVAAWDIASSEYLPAFVLVSALFRLTGAGARPVHLGQLADAVRQSVAGTYALADSLGDLVYVEPATENGSNDSHNEVVHLRLGASRQSTRFLVRIDDRTIRSGGCAPDLFWIAVCSGKSVQVDTSCRATGVPIRAEIGTDRVAVEPASTVVAVVHPGRQPELADTMEATVDGTAGTDEDFCYHQPFFATPTAATDWVATHPGGRLFTVAEFLQFWRRVTQDTLNAAGVDFLDASP